MRYVLLASVVCVTGCFRHTQVEMQGGTEYEVQPAFAKVAEGDVAVRRRVDGSAEDPRPIALHRADVRDVWHPGLGRIIAGSVLTAGAIVGASLATREARTCNAIDCTDGPLRAARISWVATSLTSALLIHGLNLRLRSTHAFEGDVDLENIRKRYMRAGVGLLIAGAALIATAAVIGALRGADDGAADPEGQNDDSIGRLAYVLSPTAATWMIAGAVFLARGARLDPSEVPDLSLGVTASRRSAGASLAYAF